MLARLQKCSKIVQLGSKTVDVWIFLGLFPQEMGAPLRCCTLRYPALSLGHNHWKYYFGDHALASWLYLSDQIWWIFSQMYAPTTLAPARDFCTLRYTTILEDGNLVVGSSSCFSRWTICFQSPVILNRLTSRIRLVSVTNLWFCADMWAVVSWSRTHSATSSIFCERGDVLQWLHDSTVWRRGLYHSCCRSLWQWGRLSLSFGFH